MKTVRIFIIGLATTTVLGCGQDPAAPVTTGGLTIELVPNVTTASAGLRQDRDLLTPTVVPGGGTAARILGGPSAQPVCTACGDDKSARALANEQPPLDGVQVRLSGPSTVTVDLPRAGNAFEGTIDRLLPGTYSIVVVGSGAGEVTFFGTASGVRVVAGQNTTASIAFNAFTTLLDPFTTPTYQFAAPLSFSLVPGANTYQIEVARDAAFTNVTTSSVPDNDGWAWFVGSIGQHYVRIRAGNQTVSASNAVASNVEMFNVLEDVVGNDRGTASNLGNGTSAAGTYFNLNITAGDQDVFRLGLVAGDQLAVRVLTSSLVPRSLLDPYVRLENITGTVLAENDDADSTTVEAAIGPVTVTNPGDFFIRVGGVTAQDVGHYQLRVTVNGVSTANLQSVVPVSTVSVPPARRAKRPH